MFLGITEAPKTSLGALYAMCVCLCCFVYSMLSFISFTNDNILESLMQIIGGQGCKDAVKVWMVLVCLGEVLVVTIVLPWITWLFQSKLINDKAEATLQQNHVRKNTPPTIELAGSSSSSSSSNSSSSSSDIREVLGGESMEDVSIDKESKKRTKVRSNWLKEGEDILDIGQRSVSSVVWVLVGCVAYPLAYFNFPIVMSVELIIVPMIASFTWLDGFNDRERFIYRTIRWTLWIITLPAVMVYGLGWMFGGETEELICNLREGGDVGVGSGGTLLMVGILGVVGIHCAVGVGVLQGGGRLH